MVQKLKIPRNVWGFYESCLSGNLGQRLLTVNSNAFIIVWFEKKAKDIWSMNCWWKHALRCIDHSASSIQWRKSVTSHIRFFCGHLRYQLHGFRRVFLVLQVYNTASIFLKFHKMVAIIRDRTSREIAMFCFS